MAKIASELLVERLADLAEYNLVAENPAQLPGVADIAIRTAPAGRDVAHLTFPNDVQVADPFEHAAPARFKDKIEQLKR